MTVRKKAPDKQKKRGRAVITCIDWLGVLRDLGQSMNCRKCGGDIFIAAVDRGTNNMNSIMHHIGCRACEHRWLLAPTAIEALKSWIEFQHKEGLPVCFVTPCGGITPRFKTPNDQGSRTPANTDNPTAWAEQAFNSAMNGGR